MCELPQRSLLREARDTIALHRQLALTDAQVEARTMSLASFLRACWPIIEPSTPLIWNWHVDAICDHVQALLDGSLGRPNLLICVPPGSMKSTVVSVAAPSWMWINAPSWRVMAICANPGVSTRDSLRTRTVIESAWYRSTFGIRWELAADSNLKTIFENTASGFRAASTTGARITGSRPHSIIIDDALDAADAFSKAERDAVITWYSQAAANRLADLTTGTRIVIQQRLHPEDLAGYILTKEADAWETLIIPMEHEESRRFVTSLGWTDPRTEDGALMFRQRFPAHIVEQERARLGQSGFAGQHQQRPTIAEGELFKRGCIRFVHAPNPAELGVQQVIISLDTAYSEKETADYSVACVLVQCANLGILLAEVVRDRWAFPQLVEVTQQLAARWRATAVLIEDKASGQSLIQTLKQQSTLPIWPVKVDGDKLVRANTVVPYWESRRVYLPCDAEGTAPPWAFEFLDELYAFPKAPHDDQVDAFVQGVRYLMQGPGIGIQQWYGQQLTQDEAERRELERRPGVTVITPTSPWHDENSTWGKQ